MIPNVGTKYNWRFRRILNLKKRLTLRVIAALMVINLLISVAILRQQSRITIFVDNYYNNLHQIEQENIHLKHSGSVNRNFDLLTTLNTYRSVFNSKQTDDIESLRSFRRRKLSKPSAKSPTSTITENDIILSGKTLNHVNKNSKFYEPKIIFNNKNACKPSDDNSKVFITCLIHSHKNNYLRRKTMRDTWLSMNKIYLSELIDTKNSNLTLEIVHLFIVGNTNESSNEKSSNETRINDIELESELYNDIIMIDTYDSYKNLLYKHLTVVNWITENCPNTAYVIKLDDDVFVNIKSLSKHLINKFGMNPVDSTFIYCNINDRALPIRNNESKWYVDNDTYPFEYYPRYCEGFAYITNVATIRLMQHQSKIIPRFWIDDVYFTGLLLYGLEQVKWFNYKNIIKWSYYDFWDLGNTFLIYEIYASFLKLFNINAIDFYQSDYFVILHMQQNNKEINYNQPANSNSSMSFYRYYYDYLKRNHTNSDGIDGTSSIATLPLLSRNLSTKPSTTMPTTINNDNICFNNNNNNLTSLELVSNCFFNLKSNFYNFHFYNFCLKLWQKKSK